MADMLELIARLEAAEAGSLELDCEMGLFARTDGKGEVSDHFGTPCIRDAGGPYAPKPFTTSLDAALALAERVLEPVQGLGLLHAVIDFVGGNGLPSHRIAPLFCAAILKAKAQGEGG